MTRVADPMRAAASEPAVSGLAAGSLDMAAETAAAIASDAIPRRSGTSALRTASSIAAGVSARYGGRPDNSS